jgi:predicted nucleic acid-binding protein
MPIRQSDPSEGHQRITKQVAVSNTGPLISALQCGRTDVLQQLYEVIHIVDSQVREFQTPSAREGLDALIRAGLVRALPLTHSEQQQAEAIAERIAKSPFAHDAQPETHLPEAQAMVLARRNELEVEVFLVEERAAFCVAEELGLRATGFVGSLIRAAQAGMLTAVEVEDSLRACREQGTRYSKALVQEALRLCRK